MQSHLIHKKTLESQVTKFNLALESPDNQGVFLEDPVMWIDRHSSPLDQETWSFVVAGLTYGRVEQIGRGIQNLEMRLAPLGVRRGGGGFFSFLERFDEPAVGKALLGWKHRLNSAGDLLNVFCALKMVIKKHGSLGTFLNFHKLQFSTDRSLESALISASLEFGNLVSSPLPSGPEKKTKVWKGTGISWFFPNPADGGACKRLLMWLRWLTREDPWELGVWAKDGPFNKKELIVPLDTHLLQWGRTRGIVKSSTANWRNAVELTNYFRKLCPKDPLKYDYVICHSGMTEFRAKKIK